jgi:opacity protein-like surface antigen
MRKFVISLAAAGAALVVASPAAAQYYPQQQPYGYGAQSYGYNGYGYNGYGQVRALQARIDRVQNQIRYIGGRGHSGERLREESRSIEQRLRYASRNGLNPYEANDIQNRIARLEQRVNYAIAGRQGGYGYTGYNNYNGYNNGQGYDRGRNHDDRDRDYDRDDDRDD